MLQGEPKLSGQALTLALQALARTDMEAAAAFIDGIQVAPARLPRDELKSRLLIGTLRFIGRGDLHIADTRVPVALLSVMDFIGRYGAHHSDGLRYKPHCRFKRTPAWRAYLQRTKQREPAALATLAKRSSRSGHVLLFAEPAHVEVWAEVRSNAGEHVGANPMVNPLFFAAPDYGFWPDKTDFKAYITHWHDSMEDV